MRKGIMIGLLSLGLLSGSQLMGATDIKINPWLNYNSDCNDGPILTAKDVTEGKITQGKPAYILTYSNLCYNSKRQAKRTVELYQKYKDKVNFVLIDVDSKNPKEKEELIKKHYTGYIPHVTVYDSKGKVVYDKAGEVETKIIGNLLDISTSTISSSTTLAVSKLSKH